MSAPDLKQLLKLPLLERVELAIGLHVDCGGRDGVHYVRDQVMAAVQPELGRVRAEALREAADKVGSRCEEYGVLGVGDLLRRMADAAEQGEKDTPAGEFTPAELVVYRAEFYGEPGPLGWYTTVEQAQQHCEAECRLTLTPEYPAGTEFSFEWLTDESELFDPWELVCASAAADADTPDAPESTGFVVTPVEVLAVFDPAAES